MCCKDPMTIDELLCKFQGLHWHEGVTYPDGTQSRYKCSCMEHQSIDPLSSLNPDFSDDRVAMELLRWFGEKKLEMWRIFWNEYVSDSMTSFVVGWAIEKEEADSKLYMSCIISLAEWLRLEETREKWGWEECKRDCDNICPSYDEEKYGTCSGKIRSEWAREEG